MNTNTQLGENMNKHVTTAITVVAFLTSIVAANWMILHVGMQPDPRGPHMLYVWPGVLAPSAVYVVGVTLILRDFVQRRLNASVAFVLILVGAALSWAFSPALAVASAAAFVASETADLLVFTALERYGFVRAMVGSNVVGLIVDSLIFLWLAFGSLAFIEGQLIGKAWATVVALLILLALRRRR